MKPPYVLSQTVEYALRATLHIVTRAPEPVRIPNIARAVHAPPHYLAKILGQLARAGILESTRGPTGGFRLATRAERATLSEIIGVFEPAQRRRCLLGHGICGQVPSCTVHEKWAPIAQASADFFARTTIDELVGTSTTTPAASTPPTPSTSSP